MGPHHKMARRESGAEMQIRRAPGQKNSEIADFVQTQWENGQSTAWLAIDAWDEKLRKAVMEIAESIKDMPEKQKAEQWKIKIEEWRALNPMPKELDDMRRLNYAKGIKPFKSSNSKTNNGKTVKFSKDDADKANEESKLLSDKMIAFLEKQKENKK